MVSWCTSLLNGIWFKPKGPGGILNDDHDTKKSLGVKKRKTSNTWDNVEENYREAV